MRSLGFPIVVYNKNIIVYYCETLGNNQFNLMLARSADVVVTDFNDIKNLKELIEKGNVYEGLIE